MAALQPDDAGDDTRLMLAVAGGEVERLADLFDRHASRLCGFLCRQVGNQATAEDLAQEVFARVLRYRTTYRGDAPFGAWLYQLARHVVADHFRGPAQRQAREVGAEVAERATLHPHWRGPRPVDPHATLERNESLRQLRSALDALPEAQRELLLLARFSTLPYDEIADLLGCTVGTVKVRVHRAVKALRALYLGTDARPLPVDACPN